MNSARAALLERCLHLEARLLGIALPEPATLPARAPRIVRYHRVGVGDIAEMHALKDEGLNSRQIAARIGCSDCTVRRYWGAR